MLALRVETKRGECAHWITIIFIFPMPKYRQTTNHNKDDPSTSEVLPESNEP